MTKIYHFSSYGKRQEKYDLLNNTNFQDVSWQELELKEPYYFFVPKDFGAKEKYDEGFSVSEIFKEFNSGIESQKDIVSIQFSRFEIENIKKDFLNLSEQEIKQKYNIIDGRDWKILLAMEDLKNIEYVESVLYRPFDIRYTYYSGKTKGFWAYPRFSVLFNMLNLNLSLNICKQQSSSSFQHIFVSNKLTERCTISSQTKEGNYVFPLYLYTPQNPLTPKGGIGSLNSHPLEGLGEVKKEKIPNFNPEIIAKIEEKLGMKLIAQDPLTPKGGIETLTPPPLEGLGEVFNYSPLEEVGEFGERSEYDKPGYVTANSYSYKYIKETRDELKNNMTKAEKVIWEELKTKKLGFKFRRQHIIDNFIVDFVCLDRKIIIEIDGEIHEKQKEKDFYRTQKLNELGFKVIRFKNEEIFSKINLVLENIKENLKNPPSGVGGSSNDLETGGSFFTPINLFDYMYAVLHSKTYRETYKEFLKIDFPKIPFDVNKETFSCLAKLGEELRSYHLLENPNLIAKNFITKYEVDGDNKVEKLRFEEDPLTPKGGIETLNSPPLEGLGEVLNSPPLEGLGKVFINDTQYFSGVPKEVFEFYIGGYQPAQKWIKDRKGRNLDYEDIMHYSKMILSLQETIRIMEEIDRVFNK